MEIENINLQIKPFFDKNVKNLYFKDLFDSEFNEVSFNDDKNFFNINSQNQCKIKIVEIECDKFLMNEVKNSFIVVGNFSPFDIDINYGNSFCLHPNNYVCITINANKDGSIISVNYNEIFNFKSTIDSIVNNSCYLNIDIPNLSKFEIEQNLNYNFLKSSNDGDIFESQIIFNSVCILLDDFNQEVFENIDSIKYTSNNLNKNSNIILLCVFNITKNKKIKYNVDINYDVNYEIIIKNNIDNSIRSLNNKEFYISENEQANINFNLNHDISLYEVKSFEFDDDDLFIPPINEFNYKYNFKLAENNSKLTNEKFINKFYFIDTNSEEYINKKALLYNVFLKFKNQDVDINLNKIVQANDVYKNIIKNNDIVEQIELNSMCYKYNPSTYINFLDYKIELNNDLIEIVFTLNGNIEILKFPKNAIDWDIINITKQSKFIELLDNVNLNIKYDNFNLKRNVDIKDNSIDIDIPLLNKYKNNIINIDIENNFSSFLSNEYDLYIDILKPLRNNNDYFLNSYLSYIIYKLNVDNNISLSEFLNNNEIVFDTIYNIKQNKYKYPEQSSVIIFNKIIQNKIEKNSPVTYSIGDNKNLYIYPFLDKINFVDKLMQHTIQDISFCKNLDYEMSNFKYTNSKTNSDIELCLYKNEKLNIYLPISACDSEYKYRYFEISKNYNVLGLQPIYIKSNYCLDYMSDSLMPSSFNNNIENSKCVNDIYYYKYDSSQPINKESFRFKSPLFTKINYIQWTDMNFDNKYINSYNQKYGFLNKNYAQIDFNLNGIQSLNKQNTNDNIYHCICIDVIGDI